MSDSIPSPGDQLPARNKYIVIGYLGNRILFAALVAICVIFLLALAITLDRGSNSIDEPAIRRVLDDQVAAWNRADLDGFMDGYWRDEKLAFTSGDTIARGWAATHDRYIKRYKSEGREMGKLSFSELEVEGLSPAVALVRGRYQLLLGEESATGRFTLVIRKLSDGWKITSDHTSAAERLPQKK